MKFKVLKDFKLGGKAYKAGQVIDLPWANVGLFDKALQAVPENTPATPAAAPEPAPAAEPDKKETEDQAVPPAEGQDAEGK